MAYRIHTRDGFEAVPDSAVWFEFDFYGERWCLHSRFVLTKDRSGMVYQVTHKRTGIGTCGGYGVDSADLALTWFLVCAIWYGKAKTLRMLKKCRKDHTC